MRPALKTRVLLGTTPLAVILLVIGGLLTGIWIKRIQNQNLRAQFDDPTRAALETNCGLRLGSTFPDIILSDSMLAPAHTISSALPDGGLLVVSSRECYFCDSLEVELENYLEKHPEFSKFLLSVVPPTGAQFVQTHPIQSVGIRMAIDTENALIGRCGIKSVPFGILLDGSGRIVKMGALDSQKASEWLLEVTQ